MPTMAPSSWPTRCALRMACTARRGVLRLGLLDHVGVGDELVRGDAEVRRGAASRGRRRSSRRRPPPACRRSGCAARPACMACGWKAVRPLNSKSALAWIIRRTSGHWSGGVGVWAGLPSMMAKESCSMARPAAVSCSVMVLSGVRQHAVRSWRVCAGVVAAWSCAWLQPPVACYGRAMFGFGGLAVLAAVAFEQPAFGQDRRWHAGSSRAKISRLEAEMLAEGEGDLRVLGAQTGDLGR